jgi:hypothetical protein
MESGSFFWLCFCFFFLVRSPFPYVWQRELLKDEHQEEDAVVVTETPPLLPLAAEQKTHKITLLTNLSTRQSRCVGRPCTTSGNKKQQRNNDKVNSQQQQQQKMTMTMPTNEVLNFVLFFKFPAEFPLARMIEK